MSSIDLSHLRYEGIDRFAETLRDRAFPPEKGRGCYASFELAPGFAPVAPNSDAGRRVLTCLLDGSPEYAEEARPAAEGSLHSDGDLHVGWYWDGDGTLVLVAGDAAFENTDCKKTYGWTVDCVADGYLRAFSKPSAHERAAALAHPAWGRFNALRLALDEYMSVSWDRRTGHRSRPALVKQEGRIAFAAVRQRPEEMVAIAKAALARVRREIRAADAADRPGLQAVAELLAVACA